MPTNKFKVLFDVPMLLGECPLWHPKEAALYWIDITDRAVHRFNPSHSTHHVWSLPAEPGCIAWCASGGLVVAMRTGLALLDTIDGSLTLVADAPYDTSRIRFNDGRCDVAGRLWTGTLCDSRDEQAGSLFCVEHGRIRDANKPVTVSNGVAFSIDNHTLYHTDTTAHRIMAYQFDPITGEIGNGRIFKQFSSDRSSNYGGRPDGAAIDSEGAYWCAMYEGGRLLRLTPSGEMLGEITLPLRCPTMVAFGGPDMKTLYITSVRDKRSSEELAQYPLSGCVLALAVDVPGKPEPAYLP